MKENDFKEEIKKRLEKLSEESNVAYYLLSKDHVKVNKLTNDSEKSTHEYTFHIAGKSGCSRFKEVNNLMWIEGWIEDTNVNDDKHLRSKAIMISNINNGNYEAVIVY